MSQTPQSERPSGPIFILADEDREALDRLLVLLGPRGFYIPVTRPQELVKYAKEFSTTAVLLAEPCSFPRGGAARLLQDLLDEVGKPVVILSEDGSAGVVRKWKRMGAADCLLHPTRVTRRMERLRSTIEGLYQKQLGRKDSDE